MYSGIVKGRATGTGWATGGGLVTGWATGGRGRGYFLKLNKIREQREV